MGPTIQHGMIQRPAQRGTQSHRGARPKDVQQMVNLPPSREDNRGNRMSRLEENGGDSLPEHKEGLFPNGYILNSIREGRPFLLNEVARPAFVNHYYAGKPLMPVTNKKCIKLDECDISSESSPINPWSQAVNREFSEHSQESLIMQQQVFKGRNAKLIPLENLQELNRNRGIHSEFPEQSWNSLKVPTIAQGVGEHLQINNSQVHKRVLCSEFRELSRHSLGMLNWVEPVCKRQAKWIYIKYH